MKTIGLLLALLLSAAAGAAQAGDALAIPAEPGDRIRVTSTRTGARPTVVRFRGVRSDSLFVTRHPGGPLAFPLADLARLEVSRIDRVRGGLYGAGIGVVAGTLLWMPVWCEEGHDTGTITARECLGMSAVFGVPTGILLGGVLGALFGVERWRPVPLPGAARVGVDPRGGGPRLEVRLPAPRVHPRIPPGAAGPSPSPPDPEP